MVLDPEELINVRTFDFAKPKLFLKNIGHYAATSTSSMSRFLSTSASFWT
jgi:hypothetical protein